MLALTLLSACAYHKKLDKPIPLQPAGAIATAVDERLSVTIDAIIVRDGPGSWSKNADWDEYLMHVRATSGQPVEITRSVVVDSLGKRRKPSATRGDLQSGSKETARRYKDANLEVTAGIVVGVQEIRVQSEIRRRSTVFPAKVAADQELPLDVFFPIAPAPQRVEVTYRNPSGEHVLVIDTKVALAGLHLLPVAGSQSSQPHPSP